MRKYFAIFFSFTLLSRFLGLIRDILIGYAFGASIYSDIFFTAFRLPNLFRSIFAEGAFNCAFLPIYTKISTEQSDTESLNFFYSIQVFLIASLALLVIFAELFTGPILKIFAPGLFLQNNGDLVIKIAKIMFPYIFFISLVSLYSGILQSIKKFGVISFCPVILNICLITSLLINANNSIEKLHYMAISIVIAGILQLFFCLFFLKINNFGIFVFKIKFNNNAKLFCKKFIPALFSAEIYQINILIDTFFASSVLHGISYLYYADRIIQLPLALIGIALSSIILPLASKAINKSIKEVIEVQNNALIIAITLTVPACVGIFVLAQQIIESLFMLGGNFDYSAVIKTSQALKVFAFALPSYIFNKIFITTFFAKGDTKTPVKFAVINLIINLILNFILTPYLQHVGIAIASVVSGWVNFIMIILHLRRHNLYKVNDFVKNAIKNSFIASSAMFFVLDILSSFLFQNSTQLTTFLKISNLLLLVFLSIAIYFGIILLIKKMSKSSAKVV